MNGFSPHLPWLYGQFLHFQKLKGVIWRNYSGIKTSHQADKDFMFLRHLFLQFTVCRWDWGQPRELKMSRWDLLLRTASTPTQAQQWVHFQRKQIAHVSFCCYRSSLERNIEEGGASSSEGVDPTHTPRDTSVFPGILAWTLLSEIWSWTHASLLFLIWGEKKCSNIQMMI